MEDPLVVERFTALLGGRYLSLEVRARGRGAGLPLALVTTDGEVALNTRDLEWLLAVAPRALKRVRQEAA